MSDLKGVLGQGGVISNILGLLNSNTQSCRILLSGKSGTGKTHIAKEILRKWKEDERYHAVLYTEGDIVNVERALFPFNSALSKLKMIKSDKITIASSVTELAKGIPYAGDFVSFFMGTVTTNKERMIENEIRYLTSAERSIVFDLCRIFPGKRLLLIADNFHSWDEASINFLRLILSGRLSDSFPIFKNVNVLCVLTDDQESVSKSSVDSLIGENGFTLFHIQGIGVDSYQQVLNYFGFRGKLTDKAIKVLYSLTGGHLELIKQLSEYASDFSFRSEEINEAFFHESDRLKQEFLERILTVKLKSLGALGSQIIQVLEYASIIGLSFSYEEIACISKEKEDTLKLIIEKAKDSSLLEDSALKKNFTHEIIREFFFERLQDRRFGYFKTFAECLSLLHPADYYTRAKYSFESGNTEDGTVLYLIGNLKDMREGTVTPQFILNRIENFASRYGLQDYLSSMKKAYDLYGRNEFLLAIAELRKIEDLYQRPLLAEKYYLLSINLTKTLSHNDLREARSILEGWDELKDHESEIWLRIMSTLMIVHSHLNDSAASKSVERALMMFLSERIKFDLTAQYNINILRRKAASLYVDEIACERTKRSVEFFATSDNDRRLIYPIQYYMSLTNYAGNLLAAGEFEDSFKYANMALNTINECPSIVFPRPMIPANNFIVSGLLSKMFSPAEAMKMFSSIISQKETIADEVLLKNNIAVTYILNGKVTDGENKLMEIIELLRQHTRIDNYYEYLPRVNLATVMFINGNAELARKGLEELEVKIPDIPDRAFLLRRHQLLYELFGKLTKITWQEWYECISRLYPHELGRSWRFFSKGFLFTDMQFWSES